jgi:hypothetical protein
VFPQQVEEEQRKQNFLFLLTLRTLLLLVLEERQLVVLIDMVFKEIIPVLVLLPQQVEATELTVPEQHPLMVVTEDLAVEQVQAMVRLIQHTPEVPEHRVKVIMVGQTTILMLTLAELVVVLEVLEVTPIMVKVVQEVPLFLMQSQELQLIMQAEVGVEKVIMVQPQTAMPELDLIHILVQEWAALQLERMPWK